MLTQQPLLGRTHSQQFEALESLAWKDCHELHFAEEADFGRREARWKRERHCVSSCIATGKRSTVRSGHDIIRRSGRERITRPRVSGKSWCPPIGAPPPRIRDPCPILHSSLPSTSLLDSMLRTSTSQDKGQQDGYRHCSSHRTSVNMVSASRPHRHRAVPRE